MTVKEAIKTILTSEPQSLKDVVIKVVHMVEQGTCQTKAISITDVINRLLNEMVRKGELTSSLNPETNRKVYSLKE